MTLRFTDGVEFNTDGEYRIVRKHDGLYVVGHGYLIPCEDIGEASRTLRALQEARREGQQKE